MKKLESFGRFARKIALGCGKNLSNDVLIGDLGELTIENKMLMLKIRYYFNLKKDHSRLVSETLEKIEKWNKNNNRNQNFFLGRMENIMKEMNLNVEELMNMEKEKRKIKIKEIIYKKQENEWLNSRKKNKKLIYYNQLKNKLEKEKYLKTKNRKSARIKMKLRSGNLDLEIEKQRGKCLRDKRMCKLCNNQIEDEFHFVAECKRLDKKRKEYTKEIEELKVDLYSNNLEVKIKFFNFIFCSNEDDKKEKLSRKILKSLYKDLNFSKYRRDNNK